MASPVAIAEGVPIPIPGEAQPARAHQRRYESYVTRLFTTATTSFLMDCLGLVAFVGTVGSLSIKGLALASLRHHSGLQHRARRAAGIAHDPGLFETQSLELCPSLHWAGLVCEAVLCIALCVACNQELSICLFGGRPRHHMIATPGVAAASTTVAAEAATTAAAPSEEALPEGGHVHLPRATQAPQPPPLPPPPPGPDEPHQVHVQYLMVHDSCLNTALQRRVLVLALSFLLTILIVSLVGEERNGNVPPYCSLGGALESLSQSQLIRGRSLPRVATTGPVAMQLLAVVAHSVVYYLLLGHQSLLHIGIFVSRGESYLACHRRLVAGIAWSCLLQYVFHQLIHLLVTVCTLVFSTFDIFYDAGRLAVFGPVAESRAHAFRCWSVTDVAHVLAGLPRSAHPLADNAWRNVTLLPRILPDIPMSGALMLRFDRSLWFAMRVCMALLAGIGVTFLVGGRDRRR